MNQQHLKERQGFYLALKKMSHNWPCVCRENIAHKKERERGREKAKTGRTEMRAEGPLGPHRCSILKAIYNSVAKLAQCVSLLPLDDLDPIVLPLLLYNTIERR